MNESISAVKRALRGRGFTDEVINDFIEESNFTECLKVLDFIASSETIASWNTRYRFALIVALCARRDRKRILYGINKRNVRTEEQLHELAARYRVHFWERCPKIINGQTKKRATQQVIENYRQQG